MAKYLVLVEVDDEDRHNLVTICNDIGAVGDHVTVEKAVNLKFLERIEGVQVEEFVDPDDCAQAEVSVQPSKFSSGQWVDVILLPGDDPFKWA